MCYLKGVINPPRMSMRLLSSCVLTSSVRPKNSVTYLSGNREQKFVGFSLKSFCCRDPALPPLKAIRRVSDQYLDGSNFGRLFHHLSPTILCSGQKVRILVVSSENCGLRTVNLALSHSGCRTRVKAIFFLKLLMV